jgi:hypothetical protein
MEMHVVISIQDQIAFISKFILEEFFLKINTFELEFLSFTAHKI